MVSPAGRVSEKLRSVSGVALLLLIKMETVFVPPKPIAAGVPKDLVAVSAGKTVRVVDAVLMFVTAPPLAFKLPGGISLVNVPEAVKSARTVTVIVQEPNVVGLGRAGIEPLFNVTEFAVVDTVPAPQVVTGAGVVRTVKPAGIVSVILTLVYAELVGFSSVIVRTEVLPATILFGANTFESPTGWILRSASTSVSLVTPCWVLSEPGADGPAGIVFV